MVDMKQLSHALGFSDHFNGAITRNQPLLYFRLSDPFLLR